MLDERGRFWNGPFLIDHAAMTRAFASWIRRHPDDGRFILTNGYDWTYFTVKDSPFFVRRATRAADDSGVALELSDGTEEALDPAAVTVSDDGVLYARVKNGQYSARFLSGAQAEMVDVIDEDSEGKPCLEVGGRRYSIARTAEKV